MKKYQKSYFLIICSIFIFQSIWSQSETENLKKYWDYRDRLKKYFLKIGYNPGESIPMENRVDGFNSGNGLSKIRFGDANIHLGYYISVLASEYKMLHDALQFDEAQRTKNELYYAIQAVNRLDFQAEFYLSNFSVPGSTNGFLIRDDCDNGFNNNWDNPPAFVNIPWRSTENVDYLTSDWYNNDDPGQAGNNYLISM